MILTAFSLNIINSHEYNELIMLMSAHYKRPKLTVLAEMVFVWSINYCEPSQSDAIGFQWVYTIHVGGSYVLAQKIGKYHMQV